MSNPDRRTYTSESRKSKIDLNLSPRGWVLTVSRKIQDRIYCSKTIVSDLHSEAIPDAVSTAIEEAEKALDQKEKEEKETMIKEFGNPSFRRKNHDRKN